MVFNILIIQMTRVIYSQNRRRYSGESLIVRYELCIHPFKFWEKNFFTHKKIEHQAKHSFLAFSFYEHIHQRHGYGQLYKSD
jgi:hypothetical protein